MTKKPANWLVRAVWGPHSGEDPAVLRVFFAQLRRKIEPDPDAPTYVHTVPRIGYRFGSGDREADHSAGTSALAPLRGS